jgi:hypothetical protein
MHSNPAEVVRDTVAHLRLTHSQLSAAAWLYEEKPAGFQCGSCRHAIRGPVDGQGTCEVMSGPIDLSRGCCLAWTADPALWQAVKERA